MELIAIVKYKYQENAQWEAITREDYKSKKAFMSDLKGNGYIVRNSFIYTREQLDSDEFLEERDHKRRVRNEVLKVRRAYNKKYNL